jgi:hypothetical protein
MKESKYGEEKECNWTKVNGQELDFEGMKRKPARRYLLFQFHFAMHQMARFRPKDMENDNNAITKMINTWTTPGSYLNRGWLSNLAMEENEESSEG